VTKLYANDEITRFDGTNQNETLMKQIQNSQKSIGKSIPAYGFKKSQEKNPQTRNLETFAKSL
jgi:hypothetical protein